MKWYNIIGILIIIADTIGAISGYTGIILRGWTFVQGFILFFSLLVVGLFLSDFKKEE